MGESDNDIAACIRQRTRHLLQASAPLCASHRSSVPEPIIRFDLRGQAAGQAQWRVNAKPLLRFNLDIARRHQADFLASTVPHEVAHLVTMACHGRTRPHGSEWRSVMAYLGIRNPKRCHQYTLEESKLKQQRRWNYRCDCQDHELSTTRHKRVQKGTTQYHCRRCGTALRAVS